MCSDPKEWHEPRRTPWRWHWARWWGQAEKDPPLQHPPTAGRQALQGRMGGRPRWGSRAWLPARRTRSPANPPWHRGRGHSSPHGPAAPRLHCRPRRAHGRRAAPRRRLVGQEGWAGEELWGSESHVPRSHWHCPETPWLSPRPGHRGCERESPALSPRGHGTRERPQRRQRPPGP